MQGNLYLVGPMGAGKTTVGRQLARLLHCDFVDTDRTLEKRTGVSISHIFEIEGEAGFREREAKLLEQIADGVRDKTYEGAVVATGGGIILRADNREMMRETGSVIYLRASQELLVERLKNSHTRPLLKSGAPLHEKITELLTARAPLYLEAADVTVDARAGAAAEMAMQIFAQLDGMLRHHGESENRE